MPFVNANGLKLHYVEHGQGDRVVLYIHGNLGCQDWMNLVWPLLPANLRVIAIEWRGCGESDKPETDAEFSDYTMSQHAEDMIAALKALAIQRCDLCVHSTGGIIAFHMLQKAPDMFGRMLALDPVGPMGLAMTEEQKVLFGMMKSDRDFTFRIMATAAPTLFQPETLMSERPVFADSTSAEQKALYEKLIDRTRVLSDGIWFGTPFNLAREAADGTLRSLQEKITHPIKILWGEQDHWILREDMEEMAARIPHCTLEVVPGVGHSMNVEQPALFAKYFKEYLMPR